MIIMCNELVGMYENEQYLEFEANFMTMAADFSGPDAQGQRVWATLSSLRDLVQEQRGFRLASQTIGGGGSNMGAVDYAADHSPIASLSSFIQPTTGHLAVIRSVGSELSGSSGEPSPRTANHGMQPMTPVAVVESANSSFVGSP
jgi:hypothetical protein